MGGDLASLIAQIDDELAYLEQLEQNGLNSEFGAEAEVEAEVEDLIAERKMQLLLEQHRLQATMRIKSNQIMMQEESKMRLQQSKMMLDRLKNDFPHYSSEDLNKFNLLTPAAQEKFISQYADLGTNMSLKEILLKRAFNILPTLNS